MGDGAQTAPDTSADVPSLSHVAAALLSPSAGCSRAERNAVCQCLVQRLGTVREVLLRWRYSCPLVRLDDGGKRVEEAPPSTRWAIGCHISIDAWGVASCSVSHPPLHVPGQWYGTHLSFPSCARCGRPRCLWSKGASRLVGGQLPILLWPRVGIRDADAAPAMKAEMRMLCDALLSQIVDLGGAGGEAADARDGEASEGGMPALWRLAARALCSFAPWASEDVLTQFLQVCGLTHPSMPLEPASPGSPLATGLQERGVKKSDATACRDSLHTHARARMCTHTHSQARTYARTRTRRHTDTRARAYTH
jgi:hypothetical protein